jgi:hypothetical protein
MSGFESSKPTPSLDKLLNACLMYPDRIELPDDDAKTKLLATKTKLESMMNNPSVKIAFDITNADLRELTYTNTERLFAYPLTASNNSEFTLTKADAERLGYISNAQSTIVIGSGDSQCFATGDDSFAVGIGFKKWASDVESDVNSKKTITDWLRRQLEAGKTVLFAGALKHGFSKDDMTGLGQIADFTIDPTSRITDITKPSREAFSDIKTIFHDNLKQLTFPNKYNKPILPEPAHATGIYQLVKEDGKDVIIIEITNGQIVVYFFDADGKPSKEYLVNPDSYLFKGDKEWFANDFKTALLSVAGGKRTRRRRNRKTRRRRRSRRGRR